MKDNKLIMISDEMSDKIIDLTEKIVLSQGVKDINVRVILEELGITNRVFYNRFHNIDEVLTIVYERTIEKIHSDIVGNFDLNGDYFEQIIDVMSKTLILTYQNKMQFNLYVFENDSANSDNYLWWKKQIKKLIEIGYETGNLKKLDSDTMSYAIWCFIRGFNADALVRGLPLDEAIDKFKYSFKILLDGMSV